MKFSETVMLGGSCLSAGVVLNGKSDVTVLERGATIGGEYFDTYCPVAPMEQEVRYEPVRQLQEALRERGALNDPYALAPLLYRALVPHTSRFHLYLEILEVRRVGTEWEVVYCDAGGVDSIRCRRVIDTTPECRLFPEFARRFLHGQFLSAEIYTENPDAFFQWEGSGLVFHRGREFNELYFSCDFPPGVSPAEMRRILFQRWAERPAGLREGRIRSIGKRVGFRMACPAAKLDENLYWVDPVRFPNPLAALDNADVALEGAEECPVTLSSRAEPENPAAVLLYSELKNRTCVRSRKPVTFDFSTDLLVAGLGSGGSLAAVTAADGEPGAVSRATSASSSVSRAVPLPVSDAVTKTSAPAPTYASLPPLRSDENVIPELRASSLRSSRSALSYASFALSIISS